MKIFTPEEDQIIILNNPIVGPLELSKLLSGKTITQIKRRIIRLQRILGLNLSMPKEIRSKFYKNVALDNPKPFDEYNINTQLFVDLAAPETIYLLGFLWADGYAIASQNGNRRTRNIVGCSIAEKDYLKIKHIFDFHGKWKTRRRQSKLPNRQPVVESMTVNTPLFKFLEENDYRIKSGASPDKILSKIPDHLKHYWWRGYLDGDGCICVYDKRFKNDKYDYLTKMIAVSFTSCSQQDWSFCKKLFSGLNIKFDIRQRIHTPSAMCKNGGKSSACRVTRWKDCVDLCNYIYQNYEIEQIGLDRKYEKFYRYLSFRTDNNLHS